MNISVKEQSDSLRLITIIGDDQDLAKIKKHALELLQRDVEAPGFRKGKAPLNVVEKQVGSNRLQSEVLEEAVNHLYSEGMVQEGLRPIDQPKIEVKKFTPYSEIEFTAEVEVMPPVKLGDYKKISKKRESPKVSDKEIDDVIENLRTRAADKKEVKRAAKDGDELVIDFEGKDADGKDVAGASGKDYPIRLGSKTFIPGFEDNLLGLKAGEDKTFDVTFPKEYSHKPLAGAKVTFTAKVKNVQSVTLPKVDDEFAKKLAPVDDLKALKSDIRTQLMTQKMQQTDDKLKDEIVEELVKISKLSVPQLLLEDQMEHMKQDFINNLTYRGITLQEYLAQQDLKEEEWVEQELMPQAERRVKVGMVLSEVARSENLQVSDEELELRINLMKGQNQNPQMQTELDQPEQRRDIASRLLTEKTLNKLVEYATS